MRGDTERRRALLTEEDTNEVLNNWSSIFSDKVFWGMGEARAESTVMVLRKGIPGSCIPLLRAEALPKPDDEREAMKAGAACWEK